MNWKVRLPRQVAPLSPQARLPSGLGVQIASGGVFSNTPLLSAVYYYNDHPEILTTILSTINILITHHVHKTARTDDQLANVSSAQPRNPIWIDTQLCFTNEFKSYYKYKTTPD